MRMALRGGCRPVGWSESNYLYTLLEKTHGSMTLQYISGESVWLFLMADTDAALAQHILNVYTSIF